MEAGQPAQLTGTNRSMHWSARTQRQEPSGSRSQAPGTRYRRAANLSSKKTHTHNSLPQIGRIEGLGQSRRAVLMSEPPISAIRKPGGHSEGCSTRSHPELGRENPQRRWYCRSSGGRVGRRQASSRRQRTDDRRQNRAVLRLPVSDNAGWSSPVARQAHNLKAAGSNPAPATNNS